MVPARNEVSSSQTSHQWLVGDRSISEFRGVPAETGLPTQIEQPPNPTTTIDIEPFEPSYSDREDGVLSTYLHQIGNIPRLTPDEEFSLFIKIEEYRKRIEEYYHELATCLPNIDPQEPPSLDALKGQINDAPLTTLSRTYLLDLARHIQVIEEGIHNAKNRIVEANLRLAVCIAKKYRERGLDLLDLIQEASIGLINAIDRFDWRRNVKFSAYASWWIQQTIGCGIANHGRTIRLPAHLLDTCRKVERAKADFQQQGIDEPSPAQLAEATGLSIEKIVQSVQVTPCAISLDACIGVESCDTVGDLLPCEQTPNPLTEVIHQELTEEVREALNELPVREKQIADFRYGLEDGNERSLQEIGTILDLSRERIRQLETRALDRLRHPARSEKLREFLDV